MYKTIQIFLSKILQDTKFFQNSYVAVLSPKSVFAVDEKFKAIKEIAFSDSLANYIYFRINSPIRFISGQRTASCVQNYNKVVSGKLVIVAHKGNVFGLEEYFSNYFACRAWEGDEFLKENLRSVEVQSVNLNKYEIYQEEVAGDITKLIDNLTLLSYELELILPQHCKSELCFEPDFCFC